MECSALDVSDQEVGGGRSPCRRAVLSSALRQRRRDPEIVFHARGGSIAVLVDRRAVTFRTLAVAALIVLTLAPQALVHPSFQMSFAATLGLVAMVQIGM